MWKGRTMRSRLQSRCVAAVTTADSEVDLLEAQAARRRGLPAAVAAVQLHAAAAGQSPGDVVRAAAAQQRPDHVPHLRRPEHRMLDERLCMHECA